VAVIRNGQKLQQEIDLPDWAKELLEDYL